MCEEQCYLRPSFRPGSASILSRGGRPAPPDPRRLKQRRAASGGGPGFEPSGRLGHLGGRAWVGCTHGAAHGRRRGWVFLKGRGRHGTARHDDAWPGFARLDAWAMSF